MPESQAGKNRLVAMLAFTMNDLVRQPGDQQRRQQVNQSVGQPDDDRETERGRTVLSCRREINAVPGNSQQNEVSQQEKISEDAAQLLNG